MKAITHLHRSTIVTPRRIVEWATLVILLCPVVLFATNPSDASERMIREHARQRVEEARRTNQSTMPAWLKANRDAYRDQIAAAARKSFEQTGIWFLARGAARDTDEQETEAVWGSLLNFGDLSTLPGYSKENREQAIKFWQSWQNHVTGQLYNPLYQDPQHPEVKRRTPGNRNDYTAEKINTKYIVSILKMLGAELPRPVNVAARADAGTDTFDELWKWLPHWATSPAGAFPVEAARALDEGKLEKIPQVEAGMGALLRKYNRETGMWRPEPLKNFPWNTYEPSSGFKIIARICGYVGMENFPEPILNTCIDHLIAHQKELHGDPAIARNYGETLAHCRMLTDYRHDEVLAAMEECLNGFRPASAWSSTGTGSYSLFGSSMIGAFMNWEDLPFDQAIQQPVRFEHGCLMKWRFVADPYGNWVNVMPKEPEAVFGNPQYDPARFGLKARNRAHWKKRVVDVIPQQPVSLKAGPDSSATTGTITFVLSAQQLTNIFEPYLKAKWSGAFEVSINGEPVKVVLYNLPNANAGWYIPAAAARKLHAGENTISVKLLGPGKDPLPGALLSKKESFIQLGLIDWH